MMLQTAASRGDEDARLRLSEMAMTKRGASRRPAALANFTVHLAAAGAEPAAR